MKSSLKTHSIILLISIFTFASCKKLVLHSPDYPTNSTSIVGTWSLINLHQIDRDVKTNKVISDTSENIVTDGVNSYILQQFFSDGTYFYKTDFDLDTMTGDPTDVSTERGTYILDKDKLIVMENGDIKNADTATYSISDNKLIVSETVKNALIDEDGTRANTTLISTFERKE